MHTSNILVHQMHAEYSCSLVTFVCVSAGLHLPGILFIADFVQEGFTSETDRKAHLYFHHECEALKLAPKMSSLGKMTAVLQEVQVHTRNYILVATACI